jgi:predicted transposase/invertase (TIGR01784 family)
VATLLSDHLELHFVELPKLQAAAGGTDEPSLTAWCRFLSATEDEELELLATQDPMLKQAKHALEQLSADPDARLQAERRETSLLMWDVSATKGREEGREEGRVEGKVALLLNLLTQKFGEISPETLQRLKAGPEASLDSWSQRLLPAATLDDVFAEEDRS